MQLKSVKAPTYTHCTRQTLILQLLETASSKLVTCCVGAGAVMVLAVGNGPRQVAEVGSWKPAARPWYKTTYNIV
jgi:hypothetical protein